MKGLKNQAGFTLIELVIVIVVLGILGAVAMIQFGNITNDAKDASLRGMAGAYGAQLAIAVNMTSGLPTGGATVGACLPAPGTSNRFIDCVYNLVPNPTTPSIQRSAYLFPGDAFNICTGTGGCGTANPPVGTCSATTERFVRVTYTAATGALTISAPGNCT